MKGSGSFVSEMADAILNGLTGGRHGNFMETVRKEEKLKSEQEGKVDEMERKPSKIEGEEAVSVSESADQFKTGGDEVSENFPSCISLHIPTISGAENGCGGRKRR